MNQLVPFTAHAFPALVAAASDQAQVRFLEFFTANIRNRNTRRAYAHAVREFLTWCEAAAVPSIAAVQPVHVAGYIEGLTRARSAPTVRQRLAAVRHLFDWLVVGQIVPVNPASSVRGPSHVVKRGKTPVLSPQEARRVLDAIDATKQVGLRDRALIGLMIYSFARIGAVVGMKIEDVFVQASGCGYPRRAVSGMKCRATTILKSICRNILSAPGSPAIPEGHCFPQSAARAAC